MPPSFYRRYGKRLLDITVSAGALLLLSPILLVVIAAAWCANRGQVFFIQERPGYQGRSFHILKLKTMRDLYDDQGQLRPDEERVTAFGRFIRKFSLDELLQLVNVLKGDMSLIGPRPLLLQYWPLYSEHDRRRHEVRPGISGLAQVKGRNGLSWKDKFRFDVFYVDHLSFAFDLLLIWRTLKKIIKADDIVPEGITVAEQLFLGSEHPAYAIPPRKRKTADYSGNS